MQFQPASSFFLAYNPKYFHKHSAIEKHPSSIICRIERPHFVPIENRKILDLYFNLYVFTCYLTTYQQPARVFMCNAQTKGNFAI
jgi:hypothetical protein